MYIYITGKSGSGKTKLAKELSEKLGYKYISMDKIGHRIYENEQLMSKLYEMYGNEINDENGVFNRKKLGRIVFALNEEEKNKFNDLTWKYMQQILEQELEENCIVDGILLPKTEYWKLDAIKILAKAENDEIRLQRVMERDNISKEYLTLREQAGISYDENDFDFIFENKYDNAQMSETVLKIARYIQSLQ